MATLYVENFPDELYKALKKLAKQNRKSVAAEVIELVRERVPTEAELKKRQRIFERLLRLQAMPSPAPGPFPTAEEMVREDRER
jgi:plasmid stability protein